MDLEEIINALCKWIMVALELGECKFKIFLKILHEQIPSR